MPVIAITRQYASLGDEIGREVAERLALRFVDQTIINDVAQGLGFPPVSVSERDEREGGLVSELVRKMRLLYPATFVPQPDADTEIDEASYLQVIRQVIWEVARTDDAVIIGRGSTFILPHHPGILHVLTVAPEDVRIERTMAAEGLDHDEAQQRVRQVDTGRARYVRHYYRTNWLDLSHYDLVLNTAFFTQVRSVSLLCAAVADEESTAGDVLA